jgi:hypothetical protein
MFANFMNVTDSMTSLLGYCSAAYQVKNITIRSFFKAVGVFLDPIYAELECLTCDLQR